MTMGAYHFAKKSGNFGLRSNGKAIFRKIFSEFVDNLQKKSCFSVRNGIQEIPLIVPFPGSFSQDRVNVRDGMPTSKW